MRNKIYEIIFSSGMAAIVALAIVLLPNISRAGSAVGASVRIVVIPNAPSGLTATAVSQSQISLSWTNNATNDTGFVVERETGSSGFTQIGTTASNITTYYDTNLGVSDTYTYRVAAFNGDGFSAYSNTASATITVATPPSSGGGGGGGGTYIPPPPSQAEASFKGFAYPLSDVTVLENGQSIATTQAGPDAKFEIDITDVTPGTNNFTVYSVDPSGNRSVPQSFQITMASGATTVISGIFFPPTIYADKSMVKKGDVVTFFGYTVPQATVTVAVHSANDVTGNAVSDGTGVWKYQLNTAALAYGDHTAAAYAATGQDTTPDSALVAFTVGNESVAAPTLTPCAELKGDLNQDCKVDIVDFSILAYWYGRPDPPVGMDLNGDGTIDLTDFSILAYYWTG